MKKVLLHSIIACGLMAGNCFAAEAPAQAEQVQPRGRLRSEKEIWQKGIAAAKKRHWNKQRLTRQERDYYNALRKRVGGTIAAVLALIGLGYGAKKYVEGRVAERARSMTGGLTEGERDVAAPVPVQAQPLAPAPAPQVDPIDLAKARHLKYRTIPVSPLEYRRRRGAERNIRLGN